MTISNVLRLAFAGTRADRARVLITAFGTAIAVLVLLSSATILTVTPESGRYRSRLLTHESLLLNVALAMILFAVPILFFIAQCARLGAPSRNRRLAAFRLAGASPAQVRRIAGAETGAAAILGTAIGTLIYLSGRALLDAPGTDGKRSLPTDILPSTGMLFAIVIAVPLLATLLTILLLRKVAITPFGVLRRTRQHRVRAWPALLGIAGLAGLAAIESVTRSEFVRSGRLGTNTLPLLLPVVPPARLERRLRPTGPQGHRSGSTGSSPRPARTGCGSPTRPASRAVMACSGSLPPAMCSPAGSSADGPPTGATPT